MALSGKDQLGWKGARRRERGFQALEFEERQRPKRKVPYEGRPPREKGAEFAPVCGAGVWPTTLAVAVCPASGRRKKAGGAAGNLTMTFTPEVARRRQPPVRAEQGTRCRRGPAPPRGRCREDSPNKPPPGKVLVTAPRRCASRASLLRGAAESPTPFPPQPAITEYCRLPSTTKVVFPGLWRLQVWEPGVRRPGFSHNPPPPPRDGSGPPASSCGPLPHPASVSASWCLYVRTQALSG